MRFFAIHLDSIASFIGAAITIAFSVYYFAFYLAVRHDRLNLRLSVFMASLFVYLFGYSMYSSGTDSESVLFWTRICYGGGGAIINTSYVLAAEIIERRDRILDWVYRILPLLLLAAVFWPWNGLFFPELNPVKTHASVLKGPFFPYFLMAIFVLSGVMLVRFVVVLFRDATKRRSIMPLAFGLAFWFLEAVFDGVFAAILSLSHFKLSLGPSL